jgi:hypothetical protein
MTALLIGVVLALAAGLLGRVVGMDRDRAFYSTALIVIGALYVLFAVIGGSNRALVLDALVGAIFIAAAIVGFRSSLWIVAIGLAAHGLLDFVHGRIISNPGVPPWWPAFCGAYDVTAGAFLAWLLASGRLRATTDAP